MWQRGWMEGIVILARFELYFIREHESICVGRSRRPKLLGVFTLRELRFAFQSR